MTESSMLPPELPYRHCVRYSCKGHEILRRNTKSGAWFVGCSSFPDCRQTRLISLEGDYPDCCNFDAFEPTVQDMGYEGDG